MNKMLFAAFGAAMFLAGCITANVGWGTQDAVAAPERPALMIVMGKAYEREALQAYAAALPPVYAQYGGSYLAIAADYTVLEGEPDMQSVIVSQWPSLGAAQAFWASPEYAEARKLREGIGQFDVVAFSALPGVLSAPTE